MTPGLAFFYGGLNRSKSVLNMMMMSFASIGLISILWLFYGFTVAFGADQPIGETPGFFGDLSQYLGTKDLTAEFAFPPFPATPIPTYVIMAFQMMFAIITVALISGALSDRTKFAGWLLFALRLVHPGVPADRAHGVGRWLHRCQARRARLRRWLRGSHQRW